MLGPSGKVWRCPPLCQATRSRGGPLSSAASPMRIVLLILLPDPSDTGSCLFCYSCSSVALALLPASLGWSACSGGRGHLCLEERGFSCGALGCLTLSLFAGRGVLWERCSCAAVRKLPEEPAAALKEVFIWMTAVMPLNHLCFQVISWLVWKG